MPEVIYDDLGSVLAALPPRIQEAVNRLDNCADLLEIVLDLGRIPEGRFPQTEVNLGAEIVTKEDLAYVVGRIGQFGDDNRAGIERTLHRISAIRNRRGEVVGLTCR
ncbi:MAG: AAA family ATPase, partial [Ktedonobacterales bacterium]